MVGSEPVKRVASWEGWGWKPIAAFLIMGINPSWALPSALFVEVPIFQLSSPEGLSLAAWMNAAINLGLILTLSYVAYDMVIGNIHPESAIKGIICISSVFCFLTAFTWQFTALNMSISILTMSIIGGMVGSFQVLVFLPYLTRYKPALFATVRLGDVIFVGVLSLLGILQQATSLSPTIFFLIFAPTQILPLFALEYITRRKLGLNTDSSYRPLRTARGNEHTPLVRNETNELQKYPKKSLDAPVSENLRRLSDNSPSDTKSQRNGGFSKESWKDIKKCWGVILCVCFINMHMWGSFISLLPLACRNASPSVDPEGSNTLAFCNNFGLLSLVPGIILAPMFKCQEYVYYLLSIFQVALYVLIYAAIFDRPYGMWGSYTSASVLTLSFCLARFNEAFIATSVYTYFGDRFPHRSYQIASFMGICDRLATTVMTWGSFFWVILR
ncbi:hypothetical protein AAMO2058_001126300 [Amorphochlora amoebiformis]